MEKSPERSRWAGGKSRAEWATYGVALFLSAAVLCWLARVWDADFSVPLSFGNDALFYNTLFKGIVENGWVLHNGFIGMPAGFDLYDVPIPDNLHFALFKLISYVAPSYAVALNIFAFLSFPLVALTSLLVFRSFKLSRASSVAASVLYAFLPYHFIRLGGHTLLAAYYTVPLAVWVILGAFSRQPLFFRCDEEGRYRFRLFDSKVIITIVICLGVASTGIYYAFFACFFLAIVTLSHLLTRKRIAFALSTAILIGVTTSGLIINASPNLWYRFTRGPNTVSTVRVPAESETFGLKISQLLFPPDYHRVDLFRRVKARYNSSAPLNNENESASLGTVGSLGFLILLAMLFRRPQTTSGASGDLLRSLGVLNVSALLLGTIGGFGSVFANLISPQIRAYNRISVYIGFFALMGFFLSYEAFFRKIKKTTRSSLLFYSVLALILALGILDQTPSFYYTGSTDKSFRESYLKEADFIHRVEAAVPPRTMIFQLPYMPCPEYGMIQKMEDYDHFRAYLHSTSLRWSYGAIKGRAADGWQQMVAARPLGECVAWLSLSGFGGIYLDRYGYADRGAELEGKLSALLNITPLVSPDNRLAFYSMVDFNKKAPEEREKLLSSTLLPVWGEGFSYLEEIPGGNRRWCASEGKLYIYNISGHPKEVTLEMTLATGKEKFSNLKIESPAYSGEFKINGEGQPFSQRITVPPGVLALSFKSDSKRVTPPLDLRVMVFRIMNFRLIEGRTPESTEHLIFQDVLKKG